MNVLLYAPNLNGHPQVYCRVIGDALLKVGCHIVIAAGTNAEAVHANWCDLRPFTGKAEITFVDTRSYSVSGESELFAEQLRTLQRDYKIDSTLFIEGDYFSSEFRRIARGEVGPLWGYNAAIFARTASWYPGEDFYSGRKLRPWDNGLRGVLGSTKRLLLKRTESEKYFYETVLLKKKVVNSSIVKDERIVKKFGPPFFCMPDIYRVFDTEKVSQPTNDDPYWFDAIQTYFDKAGSANVLLFFGTGAWYKGYDYFLRLAELDESTYALHAGLPERHETNKPMAFDTAAIRAKLKREGRLFETNCFVESDDLIHMLFSKIERFVSTHRLTGSSGTMLQALEYGKPVLTPDSGLVGWRTKNHGLGMTYSYLNEYDLLEKWKAFRTAKPDEYQPAINTFMKPFAKEEISSFFVDVLTGDHGV